jgi:hypothetical protein
LTGAGTERNANAALRVRTAVGNRDVVNVEKVVDSCPGARRPRDRFEVVILIVRDVYVVGSRASCLGGSVLLEEPQLQFCGNVFCA